MHITKNSIKGTFLMMSLFILLYQIQQSAGSSIYNFLYCVILWLKHVIFYFVQFYFVGLKPLYR